jgi:hypothetical protein
MQARTFETKELAVVQKTIMWVLAVAFLFVGVGFVAAPATFTEMATRVTPDHSTSLTEIRAVSGGVALGLGMFFAMCTRQTAWLAAGLVLGALVGAGLAVGRIVGFVVDGGVTGTQASFAVAEVVTVVACVLALRGSRSVES